LWWCARVLSRLDCDLTKRTQLSQTVNTAARMESTGARNRIHCSQETADLLEQAGKQWTRKREDLVCAKGKGDLQTFWIEFAKGSDSAGKSVESSGDHSTHTRETWAPDVSASDRKAQETHQTFVEKMERLVDWNTEVFCRVLKQVVARNRSLGRNKEKSVMGETDFKVAGAAVDEVVEVIELPELAQASSDEATVAPLDPKVAIQVRCFIKKIASMYRDNPFHNFEHVSCSKRGFVRPDSLDR
jgi:Adenylate and Guanylate cyclase catalytic domain